MPTTAKRNGVHYTPDRLADFLASQLCDELKGKRGKISILDPACGDGGLLAAVVRQLPSRVLTRLRLVGYETDKSAARRARTRLSKVAPDVEIVVADFLASEVAPNFDAVISNPPYVRTQVIGADRAQQLGRQFGLTGRVDLYQAFTIAMSAALKEGGQLALLTSNRFMTTRSGASLREFLLNQFDLKTILDLGDTRLFSAAVLPVILIGERRVVDATEEKGARNSEAEFTRVYSAHSSVGSVEKANQQERKCVLDIVAERSVGGVSAAQGAFNIERGTLVTVGPEQTWTLVNAPKRKWLKRLKAYEFCNFGDVAEIRVGIKTTADAVFVREDWNELDFEIRPEKKLLRPLITHHDAQRWAIGRPLKSVLYPHQMQSGQRVAIDLSKHKKAEQYLEVHRQRLESRSYVTKSGRNWYEIWVPQNPADWAAPKIVWPDISERAQFFFDRSGAIVNGDCYWIKLKPDTDPDWLFLMLAVGNSEVALDFYDTLFHNQLYAGRRRFMTQYVRQFPLPDLDSLIGKRIVKLVKKRLLAGEDDGQVVTKPLPRKSMKTEQTIAQLVAEAFGFTPKQGLRPRPAAKHRA